MRSVAVLCTLILIAILIGCQPDSIDTVSEKDVRPVDGSATEPTPIPKRGARQPTTLAALTDLFQRGVFHPLPPDSWHIASMAEYATLHQAVRAGDFYAVVDRVAGGANIDARDENGMSPFLVAVEENRPYIADALLDRGAKIDDKDLLGNSAMHLAARSSYIYTMENLLRRGAWTEARNNANYTPLHVACEEGELFAVQHLLRLGADRYSLVDPAVLSIPAIVAARAEQWDVTAYFRYCGQHLGIHMMVGLGDERGVTELLDDLPFLVDHPNATSQSTPLMAAVSTRRVEMIPFLATRGATLDTINIEGNTAMALALQLGYLDCAEALLAAGDTVDQARMTGSERTLLNEALRRNTIEVVSFMLEQGANPNRPALQGRQPLHVAVDINDLEKVRLLLKHGAIPGGKNEAGWSPFLVAAQRGLRPLVAAMIPHGADLAETSAEGETALHLAAAAGHDDTVALLLEQGADVLGEDHEKRTPLHRAAAGGHSDVAVRLLEGGSPLENTDVAACTPFLVAAKNGHQALALRLLEAGADDGARDHKGRNALYLAVEGQHFGLAHALYDTGVPIDVPDAQGRSLVYPAAAAGNVDALRWLVDLGLTPNVTDINGISPLHVASAEGDIPSLRYLLEVIGGADTPDNQGRGALHRAAARGNLIMIRVLSQANLSVDTRDALGLRPMHLAAEAGHGSAIKLLWTLGAASGGGDAAGNTPMHLAAHLGEVDAIAALLACRASLAVRNSQGATPRDLVRNRLQARGQSEEAPGIIRAQAFIDAALAEEIRGLACIGKAPALSEVLDCYPEFLTAETMGRSAVHWAASHGNIPVLGLLQQRGANLSGVDHTLNGYTPLHGAVAEKQYEAVAFLINAGASLEAKSANGQTPRELAQAEGLDKIVALLTREPASP